jgi:hypothetical protein
MPGSVVLETAIGLVFVFLAASLLCSAAVEWLGSWRNKRGEFLLRGLREMLDIPPATPEETDAAGTVEPTGSRGLLQKAGRRRQLQELSRQSRELPARLAEGPQEAIPAPLADLVLAHPNIAALHRPAVPGKPSSVPGQPGPRRYPWQLDPDRMHLASYVSAQAFTRSLLDLVAPDGAGRSTTVALAHHIGRLPTAVPARDALLALLRDAGNDVAAFRQAVEQWYDEQMGRVSGWYKRWAQRRLLLAGALLAVVMNVDSIAIARSLYEDEPVRKAAVAQAVSAQGCPDLAADPRACLAGQQNILRGLSVPLGWNLGDAVAECREPGRGATCWPGEVWKAVTDTGGGGLPLRLLGWLLTAAAVSFGAPFWFDALSKLGSLRTAGRRPGENSPYNPNR